jgi:hypothetical protein
MLYMVDGIFITNRKRRKKSGSPQKNCQERKYFITRA